MSRGLLKLVLGLTHGVENGNKFYFIKIQEVYFCHQELTQELNIKAVQTQKLKNLMNLVSKYSFWDTNLRTLFFTKANKAALS